MDKNEVQKVKALLTPGKKIVITTHANPDGDAMGSSLAMWHYLKLKGCKPIVIVPTAYPDFLAWMPGDNEVMNFQWKTEHGARLINECDLIFSLDYNGLSRTAEMEKYLAAAKAPKVMIDHHLLPESFPLHSFSNTAASSTCEMVYRFIEAAGDVDLINKDIATCIYVGILTDTGGFQFPITSPLVHRITADLIERGADNSLIYQRVFNTYTETRLRLFGYCLVEKMKLFKELKTAVITLNREELQRFNIKTGDTEGLVNYPLKMDDINFAALIIDRTEKIKLSFRSKGSFDVNKFSRAHFSGGGHMNASGGQSSATLEEVVKKFEEVIPQYKKELDYSI